MDNTKISGLSKRETQALHGLAILLMLYHHLFCIQTRIHVSYYSLLGRGIEEKAAWFGKICVAIFAFTSGYGLCKSAKYRKLGGLKLR